MHLPTWSGINWHWVNPSSWDRTTPIITFLNYSGIFSSSLCGFFFFGFSRKSLWLHWSNFYNLLINPSHFGRWTNSFGLIHCIWCFHWDFWVYTLNSSSSNTLTLPQNNLALLKWLHQRRISPRLHPLLPPLWKKMGKQSKHPSLQIIRPTNLTSVGPEAHHSSFDDD